MVVGGDDLDVSTMIGSHDFVAGLLPPRLGSSSPRSAANAGIDCFLWGMSCGSDKTILGLARTCVHARVNTLGQIRMLAHRDTT